ncbi:glycoside hydrolase family 95-like protein [Streptomyces heilongjiangensis]|uniref:Glycoside hydrolase family 95-like protein n=1 Tax=Streptomyces heilongjiangensis TaxID=945052 RepID=A0ABW1AZA3_9ACTN|nr:hypothetical protein [Streptomyces heilongjiangensis]MDC2951451.1 hypothetical protein [Streptomyces heilongjiangensis]
MVELLVQSHEGAVSLLRTLPPSWLDGRVAGIRCPGGHTVDMDRWDGELAAATIRAGHMAGPTARGGPGLHGSRHPHGFFG